MVRLKMIKKHSVLLAFTASILASSSAYAATADADLVAERIKEIYAEQGVNINFESVTASGNDITLGNTTLQLKSISGDAFDAGDIQLKTVDAPADGTFTIGEIIVPDLLVEEPEEKAVVTLNGLRLENVILPAKDAKTALDKMVFYEKTSIGEMTVRVDGVTRSSIKDVVTTLNTSDRQQKIDFAMGIGNIFLSMEGEPAEENPLAPLGMTELNISVQSNGSWEPQKGNVQLQNLKFNAQDIGQLNIITDISGYDLEFVEALQKTQQNMSQAGADLESSGMALLGLSEQLNIKNIEIRFDDDSVTKKLVAYFAEQQGTDAASFTQQLKLMAPLVAMQLQNPDFSNQVKEASDKFFDDPKSLTITAKPDQPVSLAAIAATAALDPTKILQLLKVGISANN